MRNFDIGDAFDYAEMLAGILNNPEINKVTDRFAEHILPVQPNQFDWKNSRDLENETMYNLNLLSMMFELKRLRKINVN